MKDLMFLFIIRYLRPVLVKRHGNAVSRKIIRKAKQEFRVIRKSVPWFGQNPFSKVTAFCASMAAIYKPMQELGISAEECIACLYLAVKSTHDNVPGFMRKAVQYIASTSFAWEIMLWFANRTRFHPFGWACEVSILENGDIRARVRRCGAIKYLKQLGVPELAPYCNFVDYIQSCTFNLGLKKEKSLGCGDRECTFLVRPGKQTPVPDNLEPVLVLISEI